MVINGTNGIDASKAYAVQHQKQRNADLGQKGVNNRADRADILDISPEARQAHAYRVALRELPEVRDDLVAAVRKGIREGTYKPDPSSIASGMLELSMIIGR